MEGVEFCPIHGEPILTTELGYGHRRMAFFPASEIVRSKLAGNLSQAARDSGTTDREAFMRLARDIAWILKNRLQFNRDVSITQALSQGKGYSDDRYLAQTLFLGQFAEKTLAETSHVFRKIISGDLGTDNFIALYSRSTSHAVVFAYLMGILYGSAENFYDTIYFPYSASIA